MIPARLDQLSDNDLLALLQRVYQRSRAYNAHLIRILMAVEKRRLHLKSAYPSMFELCVRRLGMSNGSAQRFCVAARLAVQFPDLVERIERGEIHLSTLVQMRHHLTAENADELLELARGKTRYQVEELLASVTPRPDAPSRMRKLPTPRTGQSMAPVERGLEPLAPERYRVQFNADREAHDDIVQARDLMRHSNPSGDLDKIMKYCVRAGVERLEARQRGLVRQRGRRPTDRPPTPNSRNVPRAVRRAVFERDGARCTFHDESGHRCSAKTLLELDHVDAYALGGLNSVANLRVRCRAHNRYHAENTFGKTFIEERIRSSQRKAAVRSKGGRSQEAASPVSKPSKESPSKAKGLAKAKEPRTSQARGSSDVSSKGD
jgi:5-methylcytosine-specific restriction endonuclease McrA